MVMSTMPIKYAVPAGSARTRLLTACAARYTGCTVRGWDVWDGLDTHPASQNSGRFGYSFGKTRILPVREKTMGLWERLIGAGPVEEKDTRRVLPELLASYGKEVRLARQIREHADHAPHQAGAQGLRAVAEEQDRLAQLLRDKIIALGEEVSDRVAPIRGGKNHWA